MQAKVNECSGVMNEGRVMQQGQRAREGDETTLAGERAPPKTVKRPFLRLNNLWKLISGKCLLLVDEDDVNECY